VTLYRVFWQVDGVEPHESGGAVFVPPQGAGRFDNPGDYAILYASLEEQGAIAERLGRFPIWSPALLEPPPALPSTARRAVATYEVNEEARLEDLDDPRSLVELRTRPSRVITRDRAISQALALQIFLDRSAAGVRWWSYYEALWTSVGIWSLDSVIVTNVRALRLTDDPLLGAAAVIGRRVEHH